MSDLISRQDAIDAIDKLTKKHFDFPVVMHNVRNAIEALPSAQPEDCDTCKYGYFGDGMCDYCRVGYPSNYERRTE